MVRQAYDILLTVRVVYRTVLAAGGSTENRRVHVPEGWHKPTSHTGEATQRRAHRDLSNLKSQIAWLERIACRTTPSKPL